MQGQNNIDADASANCDQGILRKNFKRTIILQKVMQRKIIFRKKVLIKIFKKYALER